MDSTDSNTHRVNRKELGEVWLRVSKEGAVPIGMMRKALCPHAFGTGEKDAYLRRPYVVRKVLIGC